MQDVPESLLFVKIFTAGHEVPTDKTILSFKRVVRRFLRDNADNGEKYSGDEVLLRDSVYNVLGEVLKGGRGRPPLSPSLLIICAYSSPCKQCWCTRLRCEGGFNTVCDWWKKGTTLTACTSDTPVNWHLLYRQADRRPLYPRSESHRLPDLQVCTVQSFLW